MTTFLTLGTVPDGYFGRITKGAFVHDPDSLATLFVWRGGYFRIGIPDTSSHTSALWTLESYIRIGRMPYTI